MFIMALFIMTIITFAYDFVGYHSTNTLDHALIFLVCIVNKDVFVNLVSLKSKVQPPLILRLGEIVSGLEISSRRTIQGKQCSLFESPWQKTKIYTLPCGGWAQVKLSCHVHQIGSLVQPFRPSTTTLVNYFNYFSCTWFRASLQLTRPRCRSDCSSLQLNIAQPGPLLQPLQVNRSMRPTYYRTTIVNYDADSHQHAAGKKYQCHRGTQTQTNPQQTTQLNHCTVKIHFRTLPCSADNMNIEYHLFINSYQGTLPYSCPTIVNYSD